MADNLFVFDFDTIRAGDHIEEHLFQLTDAALVGLDFTGYNLLEMKIVKADTSVVAATIPAGPLLEWSDAATGILSFGPLPTTGWGTGEFQYAITMLSPEGLRKTYIGGKIPIVFNPNNP